MEQREYEKIFKYLQSGSFPSLTRNEKDSLRRKAKNFVVKDGLLYYRDRKKNCDLQVGCYFNIHLASVCLISRTLLSNLGRL